MNLYIKMSLCRILVLDKTVYVDLFKYHHVEINVGSVLHMELCI